MAEGMKEFLVHEGITFLAVRDDVGATWASFDASREGAEADAWRFLDGVRSAYAHALEGGGQEFSVRRGRDGDGRAAWHLVSKREGGEEVVGSLPRSALSVRPPHEAMSMLTSLRDIHRIGLREGIDARLAPSPSP